MFSFNTPQSKSRRLVVRAALAGLLCLASAFLFLSCPMEGSTGGGGGGTSSTTSGNLVGTWSYVYDPDGPNEFTTTIRITNTTAGYPGSWEGTIVNSPTFTATTGVLICKITKYADWATPPNPLESTHSNVGKFCGMYWKGLSAKQVYLADAYSGYDHALFNTQAEAAAAFTPVADKVGTYVPWGITAPYTKQ